jgi:hypothetical protein
MELFRLALERGGGKASSRQARRGSTTGRGREKRESLP